jgi:hypothetical protein
VRRCVDNTRIVTYCHCHACMVSYAGIIRSVHIRRNQSVDRLVKRLEIMAAVWREVEDSHAILLAVVYCPYGQMPIMVVSQQNYWSLLRRFSMCREIFYVSYKMLLCDLPRGMDVVFNLTVSVRCFYLTLPYPFAESCQNTKINLKMLRHVPCWPSTFSQSSQLVAVLKACVVPIWPLLASTYYLAS